MAVGAVYFTCAPFTLAALTVMSSGTFCRIGAVRSMRTVTEPVAVPPPLVALQVTVAPGVSALSTIGSQPVWPTIAESASATFHATDTSPMYQPLAPTTPVTDGVIDGGVESALGTTAFHSVAC